MPASPQLKNSTWIRRSTEVLSTELEGEGVLLDPEAGLYFAVNRIGALIWRALETPKSYGELIEEIQQQTTVAPERVAADAHRFVSELAAHGLVELGTPPGPRTAG